MKANKKNAPKDQSSLNPQTCGFGESENIDEKSGAQGAGSNDKTQKSLNPQGSTAARTQQGSMDHQDPAAERPPQGIMGPQDPTAERPPQGSMDPQDPTAERPPQGSMDPQDPTAERLPQGSLNPQDPTADRTVQGSLHPYNPAEIAAEQGSLNPQTQQNSDAAGATQESLNPQNRQNSDAAGVVFSKGDEKRIAAAAGSGTAAGAVSPKGNQTEDALPEGIHAESVSTADDKTDFTPSAGKQAEPASSTDGNVTTGTLPASALSREDQAGAASEKEAQPGAASSSGDNASAGTTTVDIPTGKVQAGAAPAKEARAETESSKEDKIAAVVDAGLEEMTASIVGAEAARAVEGLGLTPEDAVIKEAEAGLAATAAAIARAEEQKAAAAAVKNGTSASAGAAGSGTAGTGVSASAGAAGSGTAGTGTSASAGADGSGTAGTGVSASAGTAGSGTAGTGASASAGTAGSGTAASAGTAGSGTAASAGAAGTGTAGTGASGTGAYGSGVSGAPVTIAPVPAGALSGTPTGTAAGAGGGPGTPGGPGSAVGGTAGAGTINGGAAEEDQKKKKKSRRGAKAFWITFLLLAMILGGVYYAGYKYSETHFMPGSTLNGYDCSGLTEEEAEKRFADAAAKYTLDIHFRGGSTEVITAKDIGFQYKSDGSIGAMIVGQDQEFWPKYFFEDSAYSMDLGGTYDDELLNNALSALPELQKNNMQEPENAYIMFRDGNETEDGAFEIVPEDPGSTIDLVQLAAGVGDAAARYEQELNAEEIGGAYEEPAIKSDNADLVSRCKDLNDIVCASITYVLPDKSELKLNSDVMKDWLVKDEKGRLVKDDEVWDEKLWKFMELLAYNSNTIGTDREFESTERGLITVTGGDYGYMVNQIAEHDLLLEDLPAGKKETRKPSYYISPYNEETENDGIGKTYIEVDLTAQHMWCYVDGKMVMQSDCVTGDPTTEHETPTGVFGIMFMKKDATLRGIQQQNGKYEYETKVSFWMPFYSDCGFHDAWWRTAFGGDIYKGDGSHGCVNLPSEAAEELFSYCDDKMPVVVYK